MIKPYTSLKLEWSEDDDDGGDKLIALFYAPPLLPQAVPNCLLIVSSMPGSVEKNVPPISRSHKRKHASADIDIAATVKNFNYYLKKQILGKSIQTKAIASIAEKVLHQSLSAVYNSEFIRVPNPRRMMESSDESKRKYI